MFGHKHMSPFMILVANKYHVYSILRSSIVFEVIIPLRDVCLLRVPFLRNICQIFLVSGLLTLPLWSIPIDHFYDFLGGGSLSFFLRSFSFCPYSCCPSFWLHLWEVGLEMAALSAAITDGAATCNPRRWPGLWSSLQFSPWRVW
jgi:hypothetical protein